MAKEKENKGEEKKTLADVKQALLDINARAAQRKVERDKVRAAANEARRKKMDSKPTSKGKGVQGLQGLQGSFGGKIV
jgi:hypothetical protein